MRGLNRIRGPDARISHACSKNGAGVGGAMTFYFAKLGYLKRKKHNIIKHKDAGTAKVRQGAHTLTLSPAPASRGLLCSRPPRVLDPSGL